MKKLGIALLVLLALVVAADRGADWVAQRVAANALQDSQGLETRPDVDVTGFPFLTQVVDGRFDEVDVTARDVPLGSSGLTLSRLEVDLRGAARAGSTVTVRRATADGVISFDDLETLLGPVELEYADGQTVRASASIDLAGRTFEPALTVTPALTDGALTFGELTLEELSDSSGPLTAALDELFGVQLPLSGIPFQVQVTDLTVEPDGLHLSLRGRDLSYRIG